MFYNVYFDCYQFHVQTFKINLRDILFNTPLWKSHQCHIYIGAHHYLKLQIYVYLVLNTGINVTCVMLGAHKWPNFLRLVITKRPRGALAVVKGNKRPPLNDIITVPLVCWTMSLCCIIIPLKRLRSNPIEVSTRCTCSWTQGHRENIDQTHFLPLQLNRESLPRLLRLLTNHT